MKQFIILIFFTSIYFTSNAQTFAIINDKDGFVNVRKDKNANSSIIGKIYNYSIFDCDDQTHNKSEWMRIYKQFTEDENAGMVGYVHKSRILPLSNFKIVKNVQIFKDSCILSGGDLTVTIKSSPFIPNKHKLTKGDDRLDKIDGRSFWGPYTIPKREISSFRIIQKGVTIPIPKNAYDNAYDPQFKSLRIYFGNNNTIYIQMYNGEDDNPYYIIWTIQNGKYLNKFQMTMV